MSILSVLLLAATVQPLWPEGKIPDFQPHQFAAPSQEVTANFDKAAHRMPYLEWSEPPPASNRTEACVILMSGGGYVNTCDGPAFRPLERRLLENGIHCVWLWYRTPRPENAPIHRSAWQDGQRAVRLVRAAAKERGYDPEKIGVLGCSAGSHLALMLATGSSRAAYEKVDATDDLPCHINFALPMCVAYGLTDAMFDRSSRDGDAPDVKLNPDFPFDAKTCPMCLFHGGRDYHSPCMSTQIYRQLRRMGIPAEVHIDPDRKHGPVSYAQFGRAVEFLRQMGFLGPLGPEEDVLARFASDAACASVERREIWPEGKMPDVQTNQCTPYLEWHTPKTLRTKAIQIVYSGGGYGDNHPEKWDGVPAARRYLNELGMTVVVLKYRTPRPVGLSKHVTAWQDLQRAIRLVRQEAPKRGLDPNRIGLMGSSAGGHLTLMGATSAKHLSYRPIDEADRIPCNVQWAVAIYPAYALTDGVDKPNATGGNDDSARLVPEFSFDLDTCPILFLHGDADVWAAMNSVKCWEQLRRMGIQGELHTLAKRGHCFMCKASPGTGSYTWLDRIRDFLTTKDLLK